MAIFPRIRRAFRSLFDNPVNWSMLGLNSRPPTLAGVSIDEETALTHLPILAAVTRIATDMSLLDISVEQEQNDGSHRKARESSLWPLLTWSPDGQIAASSWVKATMAHLLTWGNAYSEIEFSQGGQVLGFHLIKPSQCKPDVVEGELVYRYQAPGRGSMPIPAWKMLHFAGLSLDGITGLSPIALARETLAIGKAADLWGGAFFGSAARPSGVLSTTGKLSPNAITNLRESFEQFHAGSMNVGKTLIAEEGLTWTSMTVPPDDAQFLETRKFDVESSARLYGMHASKIGGPIEGGSLEERNDDYKQTVLLGHCKTIESQIELKCTTPEQGIRVRFDFEALMRPNSAARASYASTMIDRGVASPNDIAKREGFKTYKGGDIRLRPLNMGAVDPETGELTVPQTPAPPIKTPDAPSFSATDPNKEQLPTRTRSPRRGRRNRGA